MSVMLIRKYSEKWPVTWGALLSLGLICTWLVTGCDAAQDPGAQLEAPPNYQLISENDLSTRAFDAETLGEFKLDEAADVGIFYAAQNIDTGYFDLSLVGPDGDSLLILHSESYRTDEKGGGNWEHALQPGTYRLVLTADQSPGFLSVYWGYR